MVARRLSVTSFPRLTVTRLRVSLPFSGLIPRRLAVPAARIPLRGVPGLPIAVCLSSISLVAVEVAIARLGTVRGRCALYTQGLTIGYWCVVPVVPRIANTISRRWRLLALTIASPAVNGALGAFAKFRTRGLRGGTVAKKRGFPGQRRLAALRTRPRSGWDDRSGVSTAGVPGECAIDGCAGSRTAVRRTRLRALDSCDELSLAHGAGAADAE